MIHRELGTLCGYDGQEFEVEAFPHMDQDSLSLGVRYKDGQGQERCRFFRPGAEGKEDVVYTYEEEKNRIRVKSTGLYEGGQVFLCDCALSRWEEGNIRPGNSLVTQGGTAGICLTNPVMGTGGRRREGRKELTRRFVRDLKEPAAAVTDRDYEWLVKQIPGLCIRKTGVYYEEKKDLVCVVVQPWSGAEFPVLSPLYRQRIRDYLHKRKLLTTRIEVIDPVYIPVDVFLEVRVRDKGKWNTGELRVIIEKALDDRVNDRRIGEPVSFHKLSGDILAYPGTGNILKLKVSPRSRTGGVVYPGEDIPILPGGLCYPGDIVIQVSE